MKLTAAQIDRLRKASKPGYHGGGPRKPLDRLLALGLVRHVMPESGRGLITVEITEEGREALSL